MLETIALGILIFTAASLLFGALAIVDIPHQIAVDRNHPQQDAIYFAGWVSLFTAHLLWPLLWIWSASYREEPTLPQFAEIDEDTAINDREIDDDIDPFEDITDSVTLMRHHYEALDDRIERIEKAIMSAGEAA